jgi:hypothetical protein
MVERLRKKRLNWVRDRGRENSPEKAQGEHLYAEDSILRGWGRL